MQLKGEVMKRFDRINKEEVKSNRKQRNANHSFDKRNPGNLQFATKLPTGNTSFLVESMEGNPTKKFRD